MADGTGRICRDAAALHALAEMSWTGTRPLPVAVHEVTRAALSEIAGLRVQVLRMDAAIVIQPAVADLVQLIAELVASTTGCGPRPSRVTVAGRTVGERYRLRIVDHGPGMTGNEIRAANRSIAATWSARSGVRCSGLHAVGRTAHRRGIDVMLEARPVGGVVTDVLLPDSLLTGGTEPRRPCRGDGSRPRSAEPDPDLVGGRREPTLGARGSRSRPAAWSGVRIPELWCSRRRPNRPR